MPDPHLADWLAFVPALPRASIDLLYADPPFNTGLTQSDRNGEYADRFDSTQAYITWLRERVAATLPALKISANILLHVDWRTSHRVRAMLDDLLGEDRFVNHIIWHYGLGGSSPRRFARKHDDIFFYCLEPDRYYFDPPMVPATSNRMRGQLKKATDVIALPDVLDIPTINNMAAERVGYPTQKPLALLEMLVRACCPPGGTVLDPCCGSGTTLVAAVRAGQGRQAIGCDTTPDAVRIARERLMAECGHAAPAATSPE